MYILYHFEGFHWLRIFSFRFSFLFNIIYAPLDSWRKHYENRNLLVFPTFTENSFANNNIRREKKKQNTKRTRMQRGLKEKKPSTFVFNQQMKTMHTVSWGCIHSSLLFHSKLTNRKCFCCSSIRFYFCLLFFFRLSH